MIYLSVTNIERPVANSPSRISVEMTLVYLKNTTIDKGTKIQPHNLSNPIGNSYL